MNEKEQDRRLEDVGAYLQALREARGFSPNELAVQLGIDPSSVYRVESGKGETKGLTFALWLSAIGGDMADVVALLAGGDAAALATARIGSEAAGLATTRRRKPGSVIRPPAIEGFETWDLGPHYRLFDQLRRAIEDDPDVADVVAVALAVWDRLRDPPAPVRVKPQKPE